MLSRDWWGSITGTYAVTQDQFYDVFMTYMQVTHPTELHPGKYILHMASYTLHMATTLCTWQPYFAHLDL